MTVATAAHFFHQRLMTCKQGFELPSPTHRLRMLRIPFLLENEHVPDRMQLAMFAQ